MLGKLNSQGFVKNGNNSSLNRGINELSPYSLTQKLLFKASTTNKKVFMIPEHYTTQTCSECGILNKEIKCNKIFNCPNCKAEMSRDGNSAKLMMIKGIKLNL